MPSLINRVPWGFLDLLGIKSVGVNPTILPDEIRGVVDLSPLYLAQQWVEVRGATVAMGVTGLHAVTNWTVPAGQLWVVDTFAAYSTNMGAGTTFTGRPALFDAATLESYWMAAQSQTATAGQRFALGWDGPIIMRPNESLGIHCDAVVLGIAPQATITGRVAKLII